MIRANQIVYNISNRSVFDIAQTRFEPAGLASGIQKKIVPDLEKRGSGPPDIDQMNSTMLVDGTARCYVNPVLQLNKILRPEPLLDGYGQNPISALAGMPPRAAPQPPRFVR